MPVPSIKELLLFHDEMQALKKLSSIGIKNKDLLDLQFLNRFRTNNLEFRDLNWAVVAKILFESLKNNPRLLKRLAEVPTDILEEHGINIICETLFNSEFVDNKLKQRYSRNRVFVIPRMDDEFIEMDLLNKQPSTESIKQKYKMTMSRADLYGLSKEHLNILQMLNYKLMHPKYEFSEAQRKSIASYERRVPKSAKIKDILINRIPDTMLVELGIAKVAEEMFARKIIENTFYDNLEDQQANIIDETNIPYQTIESPVMDDDRISDVHNPSLQAEEDVDMGVPYQQDHQTFETSIVTNDPSYGEPEYKEENPKPNFIDPQELARAIFGSNYIDPFVNIIKNKNTIENEEVIKKKADDLMILKMLKNSIVTKHALYIEAAEDTWFNINKPSPERYEKIRHVETIIGLILKDVSAEGNQLEESAMIENAIRAIYALVDISKKSVEAQHNNKYRGSRLAGTFGEILDDIKGVAKDFNVDLANSHECLEKMFPNYEENEEKSTKNYKR